MEPLLPVPGVRHVALELLPEAPAVAPLTRVDEFVNNDVIAELRRQNGQAGVELDAAGNRGASPEGSLLPNAQPAGLKAMLVRQRRQPPGKVFPRLTAVKTLRRDHGLAATVPGEVNPAERPPDPGLPPAGD